MLIVGAALLTERLCRTPIGAACVPLVAAAVLLGGPTISTTSPLNFAEVMIACMLVEYVASPVALLLSLIVRSITVRSGAIVGSRLSGLHAVVVELTVVEVAPYIPAW